MIALQLSAPMKAQSKSRTRRLETLALQSLVFAGASFAVAVGGWGVLHPALSQSPDLVSHGRYLSGLLLAIGCAFWTTVPDIGRKTGRLRLVAGLVAIGGLCRLAGVALGDTLSWSTTGALIMELMVAPALCLWQLRLTDDAQGLGHKSEQ